MEGNGEASEEERKEPTTKPVNSKTHEQGPHFETNIEGTKPTSGKISKTSETLLKEDQKQKSRSILTPKIGKISKTSETPLKEDLKPINRSIFTTIQKEDQDYRKKHTIPTTTNLWEDIFIDPKVSSKIEKKKSKKK